MAETFHTLLIFVVIFAIVFALNVIPVFAPPTWTVLSFVAIRFNPNVLALAMVGAVAATLGRLVLAKLSTVIVRQKFLSHATHENIDAVRIRLEKNQKLSFVIFLFYAFSPLPSNHLFIAYGLTALKLKLIAIPFLIGRVVSYAFWAFTASRVAQMLSYESVTAKSFFSYYFIASQVFGLLAVYVFTKIDWRSLLNERRFKWRR
jgi:membrane protein YqaA with SNARE-associated domain